MINKLTQLMQRKVIKFNIHLQFYKTQHNRDSLLWMVIYNKSTANMRLNGEKHMSSDIRHKARISIFTSIIWYSQLTWDFVHYVLIALMTQITTELKFFMYTTEAEKAIQEDHG